MLETSDHTIRIGSTPTFLYFDLYLYSAYAAYYVYFLISVRMKGSICQNLYKNKQKGIANIPVTKLHWFEERKSIKSSGKIG